MNGRGQVEREVYFGILPVLRSERQFGLLDFVLIQVGFGIAAWSFLVGGYTGFVLPALPATAAILFGNALPLLLLCPLAILFARYGVETFIGARASLGPVGSNIFLVIFAILNLGWITMACFMLGESAIRVVAAFGGPESLQSRDIGAPIFAILAFGVAWWIAHGGPLAIKVFIRVGVPAMFLIICGLILYIFAAQGLDKVLSAQPSEAYDSLRRSLASAIEWNAGLGFSWLPYFGQLNCTQNPTSMEEYRRGWHPEKYEKTREPCSVLVVGGGPAGMECARVLGERGYDVHLREAEEELGGHWRWVTRLPRLQEWARVVTYREIQLRKLKNVEVHLGVGEMSCDDVLAYGADKVVIATGSHWRTDGLGAETHHPIPGADASLPHCVTPEQLMAGKPVGDRVVVLDGDGHFMGIGIAEMLADQGRQVTIVTNMSEIAEYGVYTMDVMNNKRMMYNKGIAHYRNHWAEKIEPGKITLFYLYRHGPDLSGPRTGHVPRLPERDDTITLECDTVVLVTARLPNDRLFRELKARRGEWADNEIRGVYRCGDCHAPRQLHNAIFSAHRLAREFDSPHPQYPLPWIRERQIWGHETFPKLGDARPRVEVD